MAERTRVLFVCLGNICRSPTAEVVFRAAAARAGLAHRIEIDSAGTGDWHVGNPPDYRATAHAARRGYDLRALRGRQVCADDFRRYDWILAMDQSVLEELEALRPPDFAGHLGLFLDLAPALGDARRAGSVRQGTGRLRAGARSGRGGQRGIDRAPGRNACRKALELGALSAAAHGSGAQDWIRKSLDRA